MRKLITVIIALAIAKCAFAQKMISHHGVVGGAYNFWVYTPSDAGTDTLPVVVYLHGGSICGTDLNRVFAYGTLNAIERGLELNALVVAPQCWGGGWDAAKVMSIVDWCIKEYNGDPDRVYALGMSMGGYGTINLIGNFPDRIAAGVALCGGSNLQDISGLGKTPLWIVHGTSDEMVSVDESINLVKALKKTHQDSRLIYDWMGGLNHGVLARCFYMPLFYDWLLKHSLKDPGRPADRTYLVSKGDILNAYNGLKGGSSVPRQEYNK